MRITQSDDEVCQFIALPRRVFSIRVLEEQDLNHVLDNSVEEY